jgi:arylsulfatase A-like enzyme
VFDIDGPISVENISARPHIDLLPDLLSASGYATGGFIASNPNLDIWASRFDEWRNREFERFPDASHVLYELDYHYHLLRQRPRVTASDVARHACQWFQRQDSPRFLWMHLMEPHSPYYPGLQRAREVGLLDAYRANRRLSRRSKSDLLNAPDADETVKTLEQLHFAAVNRLHEQLTTVLDFIPDDAIVVVMGDHGEEFDHGWLEHERIYDECVRVPFFAKNLDVPGESIRQLDLAPTLWAALGFDRPDSWVGRPTGTDPRHSYLLELSFGGIGSLYAGVRMPDTKLVERRDTDDIDTVAETELYDLIDDPEETDDLAATHDRAKALQDDLHDFLSGLDLKQYVGTDDRDGVPEDVERRLRELGYQ